MKMVKTILVMAAWLVGNWVVASCLGAFMLIGLGECQADPAFMAQFAADPEELGMAVCGLIVLYGLCCAYARTWIKGLFQLAAWPVRKILARRNSAATAQ